MSTTKRVKIKSTSVTRSTPTVVYGDIHDLRAWAAAKGQRLPDRGRPAKQLIDAYEAATGRTYQNRVKSKPVSKDATAGRKKVYRPNCPVHQAEMVFDPNDNFFKCPHKDCVLKAMPKADATRPIVGSGNLKFLRDGHRTFITADNNVRMDITNFLGDADFESEAFGQVKATFTLVLPVRSS